MEQGPLRGPFIKRVSLYIDKHFLGHPLDQYIFNIAFYTLVHFKHYWTAQPDLDGQMSVGVIVVVCSF